MLGGLLTILGPMFLGYLIKTKNTALLHIATKISMFLVYVILLLMGFSSDNLMIWQSNCRLLQLLH